MTFHGNSSRWVKMPCMAFVGHMTSSGMTSFHNTSTVPKIRLIINVWTNLSHHRDSLRREEARVSHIIVHNAVKHFLLVLTRKWTLPEETLNVITVPAVEEDEIEGKEKEEMKSEQEDLDKTSGFMEKHTRKKFGYLSNQHLIYQHSQSPPIHCSGVGHISEYLHVHVQESHDNHLICTLMLYNIHMVAHNRLFKVTVQQLSHSPATQINIVPLSIIVNM